jgi:RNA polymerase sigma factor (sigma-70 family)
MHAHSDAQLLRDYAERGTEAAFREIVLRHADLVYASALRQVICPDLARDVAQTVFMDLARKAQPLTATLEENASLLGWLYRSTHFAALTLLRDERRRQARERFVMDQLDSLPEPTPDWDRVRPILDEAMADLNEADREALLLRFFKNHDFRAVGSALGISDDAAQKRVSRALDRLRAYLTRRGVTTTSLALATALSAHAVPAAPPGLAAALAASALAGVPLGAASTLTLSKAIAMTALQKTMLAVSLAAAVGTGIYQASQAARLRSELQALNQAQAPAAERLRQISELSDQAKAQIAALQEENQQLHKANEDLPRLRGELARLRNDARAAALSKSSNEATQTAAKSWLDRVGLLKQRLEQMPEARIPELQLVTEQDWLNAAKGELVTEKDFRRALSALRSAGENKFVSQLQPALKQFLDANGGKFPTDLSQLQAFFKSPVDDAILQRYQIIPASDLPNQNMGGDSIITQRSTVDEENDQRWGIGPNGYGTTSGFKPSPLDVLAPALKSFMAASNGLEPTDPSQLQPYISTSAQQAALQKVTEQFNTLSPDERNRLQKAVQQLKAPR